MCTIGGEETARNANSGRVLGEYGNGRSNGGDFPCNRVLEMCSRLASSEYGARPALSSSAITVNVRLSQMVTSYQVVSHEPLRSAKPTASVALARASTRPVAFMTGRGPVGEDMGATSVFDAGCARL